MRSEFRASTSVNWLKLAMALCRLSALSERIESSLRKTVRARPVQSWVAPGSADSTGNAPLLPSTGGELAAPPVSVTAAPPVSPCVSTPTTVSLPDRRAGRDADGGDDPVWVIGIEAKIGNFADADAVEQHRRAGRAGRTRDCRICRL